MPRYKCHLGWAIYSLPRSIQHDQLPNHTEVRFAECPFLVRFVDPLNFRGLLHEVAVEQQ
jgi:hypothetical protein